MRKTRADVRLYRRAVAIDYLQSGESREKIALKYGLPNIQTVSNWVNCYLTPSEIANKCVSLHPEELLASIPMVEKLASESPSASPSDARSTEEMAKKIEKLERALKRSEDRVKALNVMIDIAEEQGIRIRKKSGAKQ